MYVMYVCSVCMYVPLLDLATRTLVALCRAQSYVRGSVASDASSACASSSISESSVASEPEDSEAALPRAEQFVP